MCVAQRYNDEEEEINEGRPTRRIVASSVFRPTRSFPTRSPWSRQTKYEGSSLLGASIAVILLKG
jgi:hypothetical protein